MTPEDFESVLKTQPFVPVRIHMSNGRTHEIRRPDDAIIGDEVVAVGVYEKDKIAWEFQSELFHGFEVYEQKSASEYTLHAEYSSDDFRTIIKGRIWSK